MVCEHTTYTPTDRYRSVGKSVYGRGGPPLPYTQMYTVAGTEAQRAGAATVYISGSADASRQPHHRTPGALSLTTLPPHHSYAHFLLRVAHR